MKKPVSAARRVKLPPVTEEQLERTRQATAAEIHEDCGKPFGEHSGAGCPTRS